MLILHDNKQMEFEKIPINPTIKKPQANCGFFIYLINKL
jgi:hypothetical protein